VHVAYANQTQESFLDGHATVVRRSEPGTTFIWVALPLDGKWS
jgi:hypothetical protein